MREPKLPPRSQAQRIVDKFGGARRLASALHAADPSYARHPSNVYRWLYPREKGGTGGVIPTSALPLVITAARIEGIYLTADDLYPGIR